MTTVAIVADYQLIDESLKMQSSMRSITKLVSLTIDILTK
jgi:hypothetical protein